MNKEYIYLSKEEIVVTDEKGRMSKKKIESEDIEKELILENYIEGLNNQIKITTANINTISEYLPNKKNNFLYFVFLPSVIILEIIMLKYFNYLNLFGLIFCAATNYIAYEVAGIGPLSINKNKKRIKALQKELEKSEELKKKYESELKNLKSKVYQEEKEQDKDITQPRKIISLENYMDIPDEIYDEINEAYDQGYGKKLKLK